jgi:hypothetical protein
VEEGKRLLTVAELSEAFEVSTASIYNWLKKGNIEPEGDEAGPRRYDLDKVREVGGRPRGTVPAAEPEPELEQEADAPRGGGISSEDPETEPGDGPDPISELQTRAAADAARAYFRTMRLGIQAARENEQAEIELRLLRHYADRPGIMRSIKSLIREGITV